MFKDMKSTGSIIAIVVILLAGIFVYRMVMVPAGDLTASIEEGSLVVQGSEINKYFAFVSQAEAKRLLDRAREEGEFKFLFPQVDLEGVETLEIQNYEVTTASGKKVTILGIRGLQSGAQIYSNLEGTVRASTAEYEDESRQPIVIFTGESDEFMSEFYLPYSPEHNSLPAELEGILEVTLETPLTNVADGLHLSEEVFPDRLQMALVVQGLGNEGEDSIEDGALRNVLTRNGKIVMVRR